MTKAQPVARTSAAARGVRVLQARPRGTERRVLEATLRCIARDGIAATSTHAIAARAGVRQGNIHYHFPSKDRLLRRILDEIHQNSSDNLQAVIDSDLSSPRKLAAIIDLGFDFIGRRRDEFITMIALWAHAMAEGGAWRAAYAGNLRLFRQAIVEVVRQGEREGCFRRGAAAIAAAQVVAAVQGVGLQDAIAPGEIDFEGSRRWLKKTILALLARKEPA